MCRNLSLSVVLALLTLTALPRTGNAYQSTSVSNGGSISGKVTFSGTPPKNPVINVKKDAKTCGSTITADYFLVGPGGGLKNAVVAIDGIKKGKAYDKKAVVALDNKKCMFHPHVETAVVRQMVGIINSDPVLHNTHLYQGPRERTLYNLALPLQGVEIKKRLKRAGLVTAKCDEHEWMLGYLYVADNPYVTTTGADGSFKLTDVPPGKYKVTIWHEKLGKITKEVTVQAGATTQLDYAFSK